MAEARRMYPRLRLWHLEVPGTVALHPQAHTFTCELALLREIAARCYDDAFTVFRVDDNDRWDHVRRPDRRALFAARYH